MPLRVVLLLVMSLLLAGDRDAATLTGRVEVEQNGVRSPVRHAKVTLIRESGGQADVSSTDADGIYQIDNVPAGRYRIRVEKAGFVPAASTERAAAAPFALGEDANSEVHFLLQRAGAIEGRAVDETGAPISKLKVSAVRLRETDELVTPDAPGTFTGLTNDLGRFRISTLRPGRYRLNVGTAEESVVTVLPEQTLDRLEFVIPADPAVRAGAENAAALERQLSATPGAPGSAEASGSVVRSDTGDPVANATVTISTSAGAALRSTKTGFDGRFVFTRLSPGTYQLVASAGGYRMVDTQNQGRAGSYPITLTGDQRLATRLALTPISAVEGRMVDEYGDPAPGVLVQIVRQGEMPSRVASENVRAVTDDRGWFRMAGLAPGAYHVIAIPSFFSGSGTSWFATTYFPGRPAQGAGTVHVGGGFDVYDAGFSLSAVKTSTLRGVATDASGRAMPRATIMLAPADGASSGAGIRASAVADDRGWFTYRDLPDGDYLLLARAPSMLGSIRTTVIASKPREAKEVAVSMRPLTTARGVVVLDSRSAPGPSDRFGVYLQSTDPMTDGALESLGRPFSVPQGAGITFAISQITGSGVIRVEVFADRTKQRWQLSRVLLNGRDITDTPYDFQSGDVDGLQVVMSDRSGSLGGAISHNGQPAPGAAVVIFGADHDTWPYISRTLRIERANDAGAYTVSGLLPGRYWALAMTAPPGRTHDALLSLRSLAVPITITEANTTSAALFVVK